MEKHMEYPKALYRAGQMHTVHDEAEEDTARAEGFAGWTEDHAATQAAAVTDTEVEAAPANTGQSADELQEAAERLREWESHLQAKDDELTAREHAVAEREAAVAAAEAAAAAMPPAADTAEQPDEQAPDRQVLKARATELGIGFPANIKTDKLAALVAAAQG